MTTPTPRYLWEKRLLERSASEGLKPATQHLALVMATYAKQDGTRIEPSIETLMEATGRGRTSVKAALRELRDSGWIVQTRKGYSLPPPRTLRAGTNVLPGGGNVTSEYMLNVPEGRPDRPLTTA